ncbi:Rpn family recombination-promoting nuclease/putative transposase [uncultured Robinsoniella sp.]|uniref:Rpn family recombination-promoting nuclease/putative transposase n=1 Tax=uncultured Robinsoniella sp. TaxID=904190 RepID=UPI00374E3279
MKNSPQETNIQIKDEKSESFIMLPTVDFCFKELMCSEKARKGLIAAFLNLDPREIQETVLLNTSLRKESEAEKLGILDVRVLMHDATQIDLEMQVLPFQCWEERTLFYTCKMYTDQIVSGDNYDVLVKCIQISILDFAFLKDTDEWYSCFHLREDKRGSLYSDKLEFHVLELPKLGNYQESENKLLQWAKFLNGKREEDFREMAEKNEYINEAYQILKNISADDRKRIEYESREKAIRDYNHLIYMAKKEGMEAGIDKGIKLFILDNIEEGIQDERIIEKLQSRFNLDSESAQEYYDKYS